LESLPTDLKRNFNLMRDLDTKSQDLLKQVDGHADTYLAGVKAMTRPQRKENMDKINKFFTKSREYGEDKVQLAMQTYEMVDKHIRRLDADLARFEQELKEKALSGSTLSKKESMKEKRKNKSKKGSDKRGADDDDDEEPPKKKKKNSNAINTIPEPVKLMATLPSVLPSFSVTHASDVLDMPVDPNEPTYCLCHQVSYGEMIGCDNTECPIEWFHFACVNLTLKPKGKWFCPRCWADRKKKLQK